MVSATRALLKYAKHRGDDPERIKKLEEKLKKIEKEIIPFHYMSGFSHQRLLVFTNEKPLEPQLMYWGLIPSWIKDEISAKKIRTQTLNARSETIFEKPAFKNSAKNKRCLIYIDAFYEHHHFNGKTYPFHVAMKSDIPMSLAGLWDEWLNKETGELIRTVSIVTTRANDVMKKIHNNPKLTEARMPVILEKAQQDEWLKQINSESEIMTLLKLCKPLDENLLECYTVKKLKGKDALGNVAEAEEKFDYPELHLSY